MAAAQDVNLGPFLQTLPLGLDHPVNERGTTLSVGQRQLLAFARALAHDPRLILGDEPTGELDSETAKTVLDLMLEAQQEIGATLIVVTHDAGVAARMDRVVTLRDGKVVDDRRKGANGNTER